ncbi:MAG: riboflavin synthase [Chitinophagaceae bacterium]|nr:MAG: riboflavin synthase [Chitinophagaceae bacterium]
MFTGIIETTGIIQRISSDESNKIFYISSSISDELKIDQSLSHNGVCLTIDELGAGSHRVTAIDETISKTNLGAWQVGDLVNLERCLAVNGRLDGHVVQGHVDAPVECVLVENASGSWVYTFRFPPGFAELVVEKGSICINGISLTVFAVTTTQFSVAIIPYTYQHTNISGVKAGDLVNVEFDIFGKYAQRIITLRG